MKPVRCSRCKEGAKTHETISLEEGFFATVFTAPALFWDGGRILCQECIKQLFESGEKLQSECQHDFFVVGGQPGSFDLRCRHCGKEQVDG